MTEFLKKEIDGEGFELLVDASVFPKDIILKASYNFLDRGYFFFKFDEDKNMILQFKKKDSSKGNAETIVCDYYDELLNVYLRDKIEKDNRTIRESIVTAAIGNSLDSRNFISIDTDKKTNQIDFDKDIDEILREIENDPELKIDEEEIERVLKEIEEESRLSSKQENVILDTKKAQDAKKRFQDGE